MDVVVIDRSSSEIVLSRRFDGQPGATSARSYLWELEGALASMNAAEFARQYGIDGI
jgi:hypothetical protein